MPVSRPSSAPSCARRRRHENGKVSTHWRIDAGIFIPGINDTFSGAAPDVGALEWVGPPPALSFYTVTPCRIVDTRVVGQGPALAAGESRTLTLSGACG